MNKQTKKLYLSCNLYDLYRRQDLCQQLKEHRFDFHDITLNPPVAASPEQEQRRYFLCALRKNMKDVDYYLVMADRYDHPSYQPWVDLEITSAFFLNIPIFVLQPWSCWSVPPQLKANAQKVFNWPNADLASALATYKQTLVPQATTA